MSVRSPRHPDTAETPGWLTVVWIAALVALPLQKVWTLPWLAGRLQPPEVAFVGLVIAAVVMIRRHGLPKWTLIDAGALSWLIANIVALGVVRWSGTIEVPGMPRGDRAFVEVAGATYLVALYAAIRVTATPYLLTRFGPWFVAGAGVGAGLGLVGVVLPWFGVSTSLGVPAYLPYLGETARARALTPGPQMLASILLMACPLFLANKWAANKGVAGQPTVGWTGVTWRRRDVAFAALLAMALVATQSKTGLCLVVGVAVMFALRPMGTVDRRRHARLTRAALMAAALVSVVFAAGTHVVVTPEGSVPCLRAAQVVAGSPLAAFPVGGTRWVMMPSTYVFNKIVSVRAIATTWPGGVGPAQQPVFAARLKSTGDYPSSILLRGFMEPHSTYLGPLAELGLAGGISTVLLLVGAGMAIRRTLSEAGGRSWEAAAFAGIAVGVLLEATATDLMNCRHYWWLLAVLAARTGQGPDSRS